MTIKRAPPHIVFTIDERKRVATVVTLLVTIAKRVKVKKSKKQSYFVKISKERRITYESKNRGSWPHGPLDFVEQACFYLQLIYLKATNIDSMLAQLLT